MDLNNLKQISLSRKKEFKSKIKQLKKLKDRELDTLFLQEHEHAFEKTDCLDCANCCKKAGPRLREIDIQRIAKHLKLGVSETFDKYVRIDEDNDLVMKSLPCPFLGEDNYCSIYEIRPKACREYPHTNRKHQKPILSLHLKNTEYCPAVLKIFENIK